ncbi:bleomycin resistance protein [Brevundimonas sp.]|uniref:bleomycin resistance protein n=1 Tax=Brevundimonas sp. TaxID=1871086 RepID=UPI002CB42DDE|nr:bleomycin resistance protein [Brevundimonas sp.]HWQ85114.1 bleomycin resistance protein [Brevundimonas sp.]
MTDHATPNLPSRDFEQTARFYGKLGFEQGWRDGGWMILRRGDLMLEFFPYPDLDPGASSFSACLRLDDVDAFHAVCKAASVPERSGGFPRLQAPALEHSGLRIGYLLDPDGSLLRLVQNPS